MSLHAAFRNVTQTLKVETTIKKDLAALIDNNWAMWKFESNMASTLLKNQNDKYKIEFVLNENEVNNPDRAYHVFVRLQDGTDADNDEDLIADFSFKLANLTPEIVVSFIAKAIL